MSSILNGSDLFCGEQNLKKYQEESTKVSNVSVSLKYNLLSIVICLHESALLSGFPLVLRSIFSGNFTGKNFSGIGL